MTAIVALEMGGKVHMGADSAGVSGLYLTVRADAKLFVNGPFVMGFTSSFRMGQLLRYSLVPPAHPDGVSNERYMATTFVDAVRTTLKAGGFARKENEVENGGTFLVGYRGALWTIDSDYQVGQSVHPFAAVGSGAELALGAMHALRSEELDSDEVLRLALEAAQAFNAGVREPFAFVSEP